MPTPSGTIALSDVNIELRRTSNTANTNMNETLVRQLARRTGAGTSISMDDLRDKSIVTWGDFGETIIVTDEPSAGFNDVPARAQWTFTSGSSTFGTTSIGNGDNTIGDSTIIGPSEWAFLSSVGSEYEIKATQTSSSGPGTREGPTLGQWFSLSSNRTFGLVDNNTTTIATWGLTIEIREASTTTVVATNSLLLTAYLVI
jgi:hypothetical protein